MDGVRDGCSLPATVVEFEEVKTVSDVVVGVVTVPPLMIGGLT